MEMQGLQAGLAEDMVEQLLTNAGTTPALTDVDVSLQVITAIERLVLLKFERDRAFLMRESGNERSRRADGPGGPEQPWDYFCARFPFAATARLDRGQPFEAHVPTARTLGCSWNWSIRDIEESKRQGLSKKLQEQPMDTDNAHYLWMKQLGLFIPLEGKNRVDFFRELGVASIPAIVTPCSYPEPHRFGVYDMAEDAEPRTWVVLDEDYAQPAPLAFTAIADVWRAYGGPASRRWPIFPPAERVAAAFEAAAADYKVCVRFETLRGMRHHASRRAERWHVAQLGCAAALGGALSMLLVNGC